MVETGGTSPALLLGALIFLIVLAAAILIGTVLYIVRARAKARAERMPAPPLAPPDIEHAAPPPADKDADESPESLSIEPPGQPGEVMRVIRDEQTGRIVVEVKGQRYEHIREIADAQVGRRVLWAIADLIRFTGGMAANPQAVRSAAQRAAQGQGIPIPHGAAQAEDGPVPAQENAALRPGLPGSRLPTPPPSTVPPMPLPADQGPGARSGPRYDVLAFFQRGLHPQTSATPPGQSSFVDEIEEILQDLIRQRNTLLACEVHVSTGSEGQLQIDVGRETYGSADEVPDPEVQALIRAAVAEWEKR